MLAEELLLGHDLLAWLVLAFGGALVVGNVAALVRPPERTGDAAPDTAPDPGQNAAMRRRALIYIGVGLIAAIWALATLVTKK